MPLIVRASSRTSLISFPFTADDAPGNSLVKSTG